MHSLHQATIVFLFLKDFKEKKKKEKKTEKKVVERWSIFYLVKQRSHGRQEVGEYSTSLLLKC